MTPLTQAAYTAYARTRIANARETIARHTVCTYTGVCLGCGRPGPCAELAEARWTLGQHTRRAANQRTATWYGHRRLPMMTGDIHKPVPIEELRAGYLAVVSAVERADRQVGEIDRSSPRAGLLARWDDAADDAWAALNLVHSGVAQARTLPGAKPANVGELLDGLRAASADADRAIRAAARVRRQLAAAEDRMRRTSADPAATVAADRWGAAVARLDRVGARLAVGVRAIERYADTLTDTVQPSRPHPAPQCTVAQVRAGARTAGAVLLVVHPWTGWRGYLARVRRQKQLERERGQLC
ncbi:hypothetical protein [Plantactinospora sp. CA-290183]|uniref:hypothetical protein n=1 Tax=Plantactinospora sp. CA-290183 TaxID=3240006 RepID=UPI003D925F98